MTSHRAQRDGRSPLDGCRRRDPADGFRCGHNEAAHDLDGGRCAICPCPGPYQPDYRLSISILLGVAAAIALVVVLVNNGVIR